jgi:hypothetical protein
MMSERNLFISVLTGLLLQGCAGSMEPRSTYKPPAGAAPTEKGSLDTGQLEPTVGYKGDQLGAEVVSTEVLGDTQTIEINVPIQPDLVDQVQVLSESGEEIPLSRDAQIIHNYETNNVGIIIRVPTEEKVGIRFRLIDHADDDDWPPMREQ